MTPPPVAGIPSPPVEWASFQVGPFTVHWYAIIIVTGIVLAALWTNHRLTKRGAEKWVVIDIALWAVVLGLFGARMYHVFTHPGDYFYEGANLWRIFFIWEGGNAIIGALIAGGIGAWIGCRNAGVSFWSFADALAPGLLLAQAVGRLGNYMNNELYGQPTDLPWGLQIAPDNPAYPVGLPEGTLFHPTFLYEMLWNLLGIAIILLAERMFRMRFGKAIALYFIWYGLGRMWIESLRVDYSEIILGMRSNVLGALVMSIVGVALLVWSARVHPGDTERVVTAPAGDEADAAGRATASADAETDRELADADLTEAEVQRLADDQGDAAVDATDTDDQPVDAADSARTDR